MQSGKKATQLRFNLRKRPVISRLTFVAGEGERALFELVGVRVDAGAVLQQHPGHLHVAGAGRLHQGRVSVLVVVLDVGALLQQHLHHLHEAARACVRQRRVAWESSVGSSVRPARVAYGGGMGNASFSF